MRRDVTDLFLRSKETIPHHIEERMIDNLIPEFNYICYNPVRACILHLLMKASNLNHSMRVEEIAKKIGKRHSVVIHHLEQLEDWNLVEVVKNKNYGKKLRRSIWGLNRRYPNLLLRVYAHLLNTFYTMNDLDRMCSVNRNVRYRLA